MKLVNEAWLFLKSKKLAVFLISIITVAVTIDVFLLARDWVPGSPDPNMGETFGSLWFQALVLFLLLNLTACTASSAYRRIKTRSKNYYLWGSTVFHIGLIIILIGTLMTGNLRIFATIMLIREETKTIPYSGFIQEEFSWDDEPKISFLLEGQEVELNEDGTAKEIYSRLTVSEKGREPVKTTLAENEQVTYRGLYLYPSKWGYAVRLTATPDRGEPVKISVPLNTQDFQDGVKAFTLPTYQDKKLPFTLSLNFYPELTEGSGTARVNKSYAVNNPALYIQAQSSGNINQNIIQPGEILEINNYSIKFEEAVPWTQFTAVYDPGAKVALWGIILATSGLTLLFLLAGPRALKNSAFTQPIKEQS